VKSRRTSELVERNAVRDVGRRVEQGLDRDRLDRVAEAAREVQGAQAGAEAGVEEKKAADTVLVIPEAILAQATGDVVQVVKPAVTADVAVVMLAVGGEVGGKPSDIGRAERERR
jgi:hypothetical protein